jgi:transducin (beta)-like 1
VDVEGDFALLQPIDLITKDVGELRAIVREKRERLEAERDKETQREKEREALKERERERALEKEREKTKREEEKEREKVEREREREKERETREKEREEKRLKVDETRRVDGKGGLQRRLRFGSGRWGWFGSTSVYLWDPNSPGLLWRLFCD